MIKLMVAALWISIVTTGAVFYSFQAAQAPDEAASDADRESVSALLRQALAALGPAKSGGTRG